VVDGMTSFGTHFTLVHCIVKEPVAKVVLQLFHFARENVWLLQSHVAIKQWENIVKELTT